MRDMFYLQNPVLHCRFSVDGDQLIEVEVADSDGRQALRDTIAELRRLAAVAGRFSFQLLTCSSFTSLVIGDMS